MNIFSKFFQYQWRQFSCTKRFAFFNFLFDESQYIIS